MDQINFVFISMVLYSPFLVAFSYATVEAHRFWRCCSTRSYMLGKLDIHVSVHYDIIYESDQQDATVQDN